MFSSKKVLMGCIVGSFIACALLTGTGCTKRPNADELARLEEARSAAESAEKKLAELKRERMDLETTLQQKQSELRRHEEERDDLKMKMGK
jgi:septal ring factor EnvC (AmiA/AmiB activator)